jgi:hypothetical protein
MGSRTRLDMVTERKKICSTENQTPTIHPIFGLFIDWVNIWGINEMQLETLT